MSAQPAPLEWPAWVAFVAGVFVGGICMWSLIG